MQYKEILTSKERVPFYSDCYQKIGYRVVDVDKVDGNHVIRLENMSCTERQRDIERGMEKKLRTVEIASRQKRRYQTMHFNFSIHIILLCIQAAILYCLHIDSAHPKIMLQIGVILLMILSVGAFVLKLYEIFGWNQMVKNSTNNLFEPLQSDYPTDYKIISVLFTRSRNSILSEVIYWCTGRAYTHASIGLGEQLDEFFSFNFKGFSTEHPTHRKTRKKHKDSLCYQFKVTEPEYNEIKETIEQYRKEQETYRYNLFGAIIGALHIYIPFKMKRHYFCSEFVAEQLRKTDSIRLNKEVKMYLPSTLARALIMQDNLRTVKVNEV